MNEKNQNKKEQKNLSDHNSQFLIPNSARKRPLVVGSVAFDILFDVHGTIRERISITDGKLGKQNLMFTAQDKVMRHGGMGGNIAYGLGLLGARPILFGSVGKDFKNEYEAHLVRRGVEPGVHVEENAFTATYYGMSDTAKEQIGVWQPNAHDKLEVLSVEKHLGRKVLEEVSVAIVSGKPEITLRYMSEIRKILGKKVKIIFDPGQAVLFYDKSKLKKCLKLADVVIVNDAECAALLKIADCSIDEILKKMGPGALIETKGGKGSVLYEKGFQQNSVPAVKPKRVVETTGAGDAYRAGLMYGMLNGLPLAQACQIGAILGAKNVETLGGQAYEINPNDLKSHLF